MPEGGFGMPGAGWGPSPVTTPEVRGRPGWKGARWGPGLELRRRRRGLRGPGDEVRPCWEWDEGRSTGQRGHGGSSCKGNVSFQPLQ